MRHELGKESAGMTDIASKPVWGTARAEWIKFWSLRSNRVLTYFAVLFVPLNALLLTVSLRQRAEDPDVTNLIPSVDAVAFLDSVLWLQLLIAVLAVLLAAMENGGRLGVSFLAVPRRVPVLLSKMLVIGAVAFLVGSIGSVMGQSMPILLLADSGVRYEPAIGEVIAASAASGLYLTGIAIISLCVAILVRNLVIALLAPIALFTIVPSVLAFVGGEWGSVASGYFPTVAGRTAFSAFTNPAGLDAAVGFLVLGAWVLAGAIGAAAVYRFRDAS